MAEPPKQTLLITRRVSNSSSTLAVSRTMMAEVFSWVISRLAEAVVVLKHYVRVNTTTNIVILQLIP